MNTKPIDRFDGYPRFWDDEEVPLPSVGPKQVPWEKTKYYVNPHSGNFRRAHQKWHISKKDLTLHDRGFIGEQYIVQPDGSASHRNGSPVVSFHDMVTCFDIAEKDESSLGEAFLKMLEDRPDWRVSNHFIEEVKKGSNVYPKIISDKLNELYGLGPTDPLKEVKLLEEENNILKARKRAQSLAAENAALRDEMLQEQLARAEKVEEAVEEGQSLDTAKELVEKPRTRRRRRVKKDEDDE